MRGLSIKFYFNSHLIKKWYILSFPKMYHDYTRNGYKLLLSIAASFLIDLLNVS